jgi:flagellar hook-associated protein 2
MAGIQLSGLSSGLDTEGIISGLMAAESVPRNKLANQQIVIQARKDILADIETKLKSLGTAASDLSSVLTWTPSQTVDVSDTSEATARVTGGAGPGTYVVNVTRLASADQRTYAYTASGSAKTVTLNSKSLTIAANASVDDIAAQINADPTYGVYAVNANNRLVLAARTTGAASAISLTGAGGFLAEDTTVRKQGQDAAYTLDGRAYTAASNVITNATGAAGGFIPGVELTLKAADAVNFNVTVSNPTTDKSVVTNKLKAYVDAYNAAMTTMRQATTEQKVMGADNAIDLRKGVLFGDSGLNNLMSALRGQVSTFVGATGSTTINSMDEIGISTGAGSGTGTFSQDAVNGKLTVDSAKLASALDTNPLAVQKLLGGVVGTDGFAQAFKTTLDPYTQTSGIMDSRVTSADSALRDLTDSIARMDDRLKQKEESLRTMFTNMELALQKAKSQGTDMLARLGISSNDQ